MRTILQFVLPGGVWIPAPTADLKPDTFYEIAVQKGDVNQQCPDRERNWMTIPTRIAVGAYIIRQSEPGFYQLLLFKHPDCAEAPLQIPGGGVEPGESMEQALHREIFEETGLSNLTIVRPLGIAKTAGFTPKN
ncbi:MAG: NUDIX domain-containing protein [Kovacikia sp.]